MSDWLNWVGITGLVTAVGKGIYDGVRARSDVRKTGADAAQVIVQTAAASNADLGADLREVKVEVRQLRHAQRQHEVLLRTHHRWDEQVVDQLRALGGQITDPPPLYPEGT